MKYILSVVFSLFISSCVSMASPPILQGRVLVETPPSYTEGERSPIVFRDVGDIGVDPKIPHELINRSDVPYQTVSQINGGVVYIMHALITGEKTQVEGYIPETGERLYYDGENRTYVVSHISYPLYEGDYFEEHQKLDELEISSRCGPVKKDDKSGYIFFRCRGLIVGHEHVPIPERVIVLTADLKWQVMPTIAISLEEKPDKNPVAKK